MSAMTSIPRRPPNRRRPNSRRRRRSPVAPQPRAVAPQDDLPPPAYNPYSTPEQTAAQAAAHGPGTPSPETLRRLEAAVRKVPQSERAEGGRPSGQAASPQHGPDKSRFGINTLIHRMTGHGNESRGAGTQGRPVPPMHSVPVGQPA